MINTDFRSIFEGRTLWLDMKIMQTLAVQVDVRKQPLLLWADMKVLGLGCRRIDRNEEWFGVCKHDTFPTEAASRPAYARHHDSRTKDPKRPIPDSLKGTLATLHRKNLDQEHLHAGFSSTLKASTPP